MKQIICRKCCRLIVPYSTEKTNKIWILAQPGPYEKNIHKCHGTQTDHEPYKDKQETTMKNKPDDDVISDNDGTGSPDPEPATEDTADEIDINSGW